MIEIRKEIMINDFGLQEDLGEEIMCNFDD